MRAPSLRSRIAMVAVAALLGLLASEAGFRALKRVVCIGQGAKLFRPHPVFGWTHEPDAEGWTQGCVGRRFEWRAFSRMNADGLRDRDYPHVRRPDVPRVLVLGDSYVEGMQVPIAETFVKRVEAALGAAGRTAEVIDAGFSGFGTDNELLFFTSEGDRWEPDVVLLVFTPSNDVVENARGLYRRLYAAAPDGPPPKSHFELDAHGGLALDARATRRHWAEFTAANDSAVRRAWMAVERNFHLVRLAETLLQRRRIPPAAQRHVHTTLLTPYAAPAPRAGAAAWALTTALVRRLRAEVERRGAGFAIAIVPPKEAVSPAAWQAFLALGPLAPGVTYDVALPTRTIGAIAAADGIPYVDLTPPLAAHFAATGRTGYFGFDVHLNAEGHEVVAGALTPFVARLLDARPAAVTRDFR
jgi:SGNH hydrolase-like domain, acetyltransferase AlgX